MALSQNEDFTIWYLRTSYLNSCKDGLGERLINVNSSVLNTAGFRAAGWVSDTVQRTHSPPIPTTTVSSEYFNTGTPVERTESRDDAEDEGGMVTGRRSNDTVGPGILARRRRRKEPIEDDDSSELSDESDDDVENGQRAAQQIRFAKMPSRNRSESSPQKEPSIKNGPDVLVTSPPKSETVGRHRGGSLGAVEAVKARSRADTATSSDMSSENELDRPYFQRRQIDSRKPGKSMFLSDTLKEEKAEVAESAALSHDQDDSDADSVDSGLSSELGGTVESASLLNTMDDPQLHVPSPVLSGRPSMGNYTNSESPTRTRSIPLLQELPPPRPISTITPISLLSQALKKTESSRNPLEKYTALSGKGSPNPLWIKIFAPFSEDPETPFEMPLEKISKDGEPVIVAEAIGLSLWRYKEEELDPPLTSEQLNVNKWVLRMVEDGEVEYDFPALARTKPITDFTLNNNRGARGRSRARPFDEFAIVEASAREFEANQRETPMFSPSKDEQETVASTDNEPSDESRVGFPGVRQVPRSHPMLAGQPFTSALNNTSLTPADKPAQVGATSTPRIGTLKTIRIRFFDLDVSAQTTTMEISTDTYIAEVHDHVCRRWNLDKGLYVLKLAGTPNVVPLDRTLETIGHRSDLDLVRSRFAAGPLNFTGSPGSPNAPLLIDIQGARRSKKDKMLHPLMHKQDMMTSASNFKEYSVTRKQLKSFAQSGRRVLIFDGDFLHNVPADAGKTMFDNNAKTNSFTFADIIKCKISSKHSKLIRLFVRRPQETKRYDFEARSAGEAQEIVDEITKEMKLSRA